MSDRAIGRLILIKNSIILGEIYNGIDNHINTFDGTRFVGEIGTYVSIYEIGRTLIAEVLSAESSQHVSSAPLAKPNSSRMISLKLVGEIVDENFYFGVSKMPLLYSEVHIVTNDELDIMLAVKDSEVIVDGSNTRLTSFSLGTSVLFSEYDVKVDVDQFFGHHSAIFGNTGAGKSNSIARMIQNVFLKKGYSASGARIILIDSNGEYEQAFSEVKNINNDIACSFVKPLSGGEKFEIPVWLLSVDDWAILLNASEKTQIPILRKSMEIVKVLYSQKDDSLKLRNHMLASTVIGLLTSSESSPSTSDKISTLLLNFGTDEINLEVKINAKETIADCIVVNYGQITSIKDVIAFMKEYLDTQLIEEIKYEEEIRFSTSEFLDAMKFAVLYEGSMNSQRVQEYTAPLVSRMQSLVESSFSNIFCKTEYPSKEEFFVDIIKKYNLINIDISSLDDSTSEVLVRVLSKIILDYQKNHAVKADSPINLFIEEAHRYIKETSIGSATYDFDIFQRISKEGRKFGFLLCVSTQRPSDLSKTVVSQCSNFIVHRIQNPDDLAYISRMVPYIDRETIDRLTFLQTGNALVFGSAIRIPMLTSFAEAKPNTDGNSAKISEKWYIEN
ncbi:ATP-binding protein [Vagococcus salmoninarum]|uniref:ATPase n=1 Tax=Vagococcus salmoninarum TaxID=2739 RepID=A0A429ZTW6_9ENTE|nr:DUF87 domain-containing protein [Vagococcus salmoninarum]RST97174.1 ATPase [Vagococcus salmoninarum]